jgi:CheY-like chemotaxis protein
MELTPLTQISVLVVDDHEDTRGFLAFVLLDAGALVQTASTADEAHHWLDIAAPDVVVVDLDLPGRDGYWLLDVIRGLPTSKAVRAIAATAHASPDERARALAAGFDAYLTKPFEPQHLVNVIAALVPRDRR